MHLLRSQMPLNALLLHRNPPRCARMMSLIHALKPVHCDVGVHLRGGNIGMSQNRLNSPQVSSVAHHVGRATVAKHMRARLAIDLRLADDPPHALASQSSPTSVHEY